jgi:hypothetical protein
MFYLLFTAFSQQIHAAYRYMVLNVRNALGYIDIDTSNSEMIDAVIPAGKPVTQSMETDADRTAEKNAGEKSILQKLLPLSSPEVFNVNKNDYSFYDAEPLCRALGAELATYDQVKEAWTKGADWCNYGWVKGQVAVYPTQPETYDKLQSGPEEERLACGTTGVNGGYFDNPEMKFGVNCYGNKPEQSAADEESLMKNGTIPRTPAGLKVDQKIREFKAQMETTTVAPFSSDKWAST